MPSRAVDIDALLDEHAKHNGPACLVSQLSGTAKAVYDRGMERDITAAAIARALASLGVAVNRDMVSRHRNKECTTCAR